jgi:hypothetical protein
MLKDPVSTMGCNSPVDIGGVMHVGHVVAPISSMPYQMMVVPCGLCVNMGGCYGPRVRPIVCPYLRMLLLVP